MIKTGLGSSVAGVSASYASGLEIDPRVRHILQEEQVVNNWRKQGRLILLNFGISSQEESITVI